MILFFVRRFNDVDHIAPVLVKLIESGFREYAVISLDPTYDASSHWAMDLLARKHNIVVDYGARRHQPDSTHRILAQVFFPPPRGCDGFKGFILRLVSSASRTMPLVSRVYDALRNVTFTASWAEKLLREMKVTCVVFDWVKDYHAYVGLFLEAAREFGIPTVALPNGVPVWTVDTWDEEAISIYGKAYSFDHIVSPNRNSQEIFRKGHVPEEKIAVLGSARFCREWAERNESIECITQRPLAVTRCGLLKVVYMDGGIKVLRDPSQLLDLVQRIDNMNFVDLVIKPKTRNNKLQVPGMEHLGRLDSATSSAVLCNWADVVITGVSSIYLEMLWRGRTFIYPRYLFRRTTVFEAAGVGWLIDSPEELEDALHRLRRHPDYRPYSDDGVQAFLEETVQAGDMRRDVLGDYARFLIERSH